MARHMIAPLDLIAYLTRPTGPALLDLRTTEDAAADPTKLPGARRLTLSQLQAGQCPGGPSVVYCQKGGKISQIGAALLRERGRPAKALEGGHLAWQEAGLPVQPLDTPEGATLIMRDDPDWANLCHLWVLRRLVDPTSRVLAVEADQVDAAVSVMNAHRLDDLDSPVWPSEPDWPEVPAASSVLDAILRGRLARVGDPLEALDLVDDVLAGGLA